MISTTTSQMYLSKKALSLGSSLLLVLVLISLMPSGSEAKSVNLPSPQCHPSVINKMNPRIKQICKALKAIWEFSDVMENYLDEKEEGIHYKNNAPLMNGGVKRKGGEDIDHVFLRFGRGGYY